MTWRIGLGFWLAMALLPVCAVSAQTSNGAGSGYALRVVTPFSLDGARYAVGALITDPASIAAILADGRAAFVVRVPAGGAAAASGPAAPVTVIVGADHSANPASVPGSAPLLTVPVNPSRRSVEIDNQSAAEVQVVRDDGAGNDAASIMLDPARQAGAQGGSWSSTSFKGRLRIYAPAGSQVAAFED